MVDRFLNLEERTNIPQSEIDGFVSKVDTVYKAIQALKDGRDIDVDLPEELEFVRETTDQKQERQVRCIG